MTDSQWRESMETRISELERLLKCADRGKARKASVQADCEAAAEVEVPARLKGSPAFMTVWEAFCVHRYTLATKGNINGRKFPWTARAATGILRKAESFGTALAIEAMNIAMDRGWADIFLLREDSSPPPSTEVRRSSMRL